MKLRFHHGLKDANEVLKRARAILRNVKATKGVDFYVQSYVNCREQGYTIIGFTYGEGKNREFYCGLSQYRSSDSIVLYLASYLKSTKKYPKEFQAFHMWSGNIPEQEVWQDSVHVSPTDVKNEHYQKAAEILAHEIELFISDNYWASAHFYGKKEVEKQQARMATEREEEKKRKAA